MIYDIDLSISTVHILPPPPPLSLLCLFVFYIALDWCDGQRSCDPRAAAEAEGTGAGHDTLHRRGPHSVTRQRPVLRALALEETAAILLAEWCLHSFLSK